jgi:hypothetical protein
MKDLKKLAITLSLCAITHLSAQESQCDLELRGILEMNDSYQFSLKSKSSERTSWASLNRISLGYRLISYNEERKELTLSSGDKIYQIEMVQSDDSALAILKEEMSKNNYSLSIDDIDPTTPGKQSYTQIRSKLKFHVSARNNNSSNSNSHLVQSNINQESPEVETSLPTNMDNSVELTEAEIIALQSYDKNYVASRELPTDVIIKYAVSPR